MTQPAEQGNDSFELEPIALSPVIVRAARSIYQAYIDTHGNRQRPLGVALDRYSYRGQLIFASQPILLPHECFVSMQEIETLDLDAPEDQE